MLRCVVLLCCWYARGFCAVPCDLCGWVHTHHLLSCAHTLPAASHIVPPLFPDNRYALSGWGNFKACLRRDKILMSRNSFLYT